MNRLRWRFGDTNPVMAAVDAATIIELGDLLWQDIDNAKPASHLGSLRTFKDNFLGVAMQPSIKGRKVPIRVATTGVFEFDCIPQQWELGDLVCSCYIPGSGHHPGHLDNQTVHFAFDRDYAIGRVSRFQHDNPVPTVYITIQSTVMVGRF